MFSAVLVSTSGDQSHLTQASLPSKILTQQNTTSKLGKIMMPHVCQFGPDLRQLSSPLLHLPATPAQDTHSSYISISDPHVKSLTLDHSSTVDASDGM
jgi:hypothetical protein